jgi:hypothetical protein
MSKNNNTLGKNTKPNKKTSSNPNSQTNNNSTVSGNSNFTANGNFSGNIEMNFNNQTNQNFFNMTTQNTINKVATNSDKEPKIIVKDESKITAQKVDCVGKVPSARFGHTIVLVSPVKIVLFGGAVGDTKNFIFSNETFVLNLMTKIWQKLEGIYRCNFNSKRNECSMFKSSACSL